MRKSWTILILISFFFREKPNLSVYLKKTLAKLQKLKNVARNFAKVSLVCLGCLFLSFYHKWSRLGRIVYLAPVKHEVAQFTWGNTHQKTVIILVVICDNFWENTVRVSIDMAQNPPNSLHTLVKNCKLYIQFLVQNFVECWQISINYKFSFCEFLPLPLQFWISCK